MFLRSLNFRQLVSTAVIGLSLITYIFFATAQKDMNISVLAYVF